jgi:16S rRNA (cytidine1402-2'-O)-methyltransferase
MDFYLKKNRQLINVFNKISKFDGTCVFFVSTKKVNKIIPDLKKYFSGRKIVFCREISKIYEEFMRKNVDDLELFNKELKGELTIVISEKKLIKITHKN